ncbi:GIY-YIG nuclease family protein [Psychroflexus torquis]|uniref:GIY-YIG nuclease family protein n=1 Tax=Psychroflexus torquis TaxID=57029 RepID=UPI000A024BAA|nr:GIY-YIG nuclease family protein [Psychroflexus torquis]
MHFLYIIYSKQSHRFYIGETQNVEKRVLMHNQHVFKNAFTTSAEDWQINPAIDMKTVESEQPDVIGWADFCNVMIEVKVGKGNFIKDCKKPFRKCSEKGVGEYRYYFCPSGLIKESELPENWGLLYLNDENKIEIIKVALIQEANLKAERNILISLIRGQG